MTMDVTKIAEGLWQWTAPTSDDAGATVHRSTYVETPDGTVLIDPRLPEDTGEHERFWQAFDNDVARRGLPVRILLTGDPDDVMLAALRERHAPEVSGPVADRSRDITPIADGTSPSAGIVCRTLTSPTGARRAMFLLRDHAAVVIGDFPETPDQRRTLVTHVIDSTVIRARRSGEEPPPIRWLLATTADPLDLDATAA